MGMKLLLCLVVAFIAIEADSPGFIGPIGCVRLCEYGYIPGTCRCRPSPFNPCRFVRCPFRQQCIVIRRRHVCVPRRCLRRRDPGPCNRFIRRFFFNRRTGRCQLFFYGGCLGNRNNFRTRRACRRVCLRRPF